MVTINGKSWMFSTTAERQIINGRETLCGCYHDQDIGRVLVDAMLPVERQLELAAKATLEIRDMATASDQGQPELSPVLDMLGVPLLRRRVA